MTPGKRPAGYRRRLLAEAPVARTSRLGRRVDWPATRAATSWGENAAHTVASLTMRAPARCVDCMSTAPSRNWLSRVEISAWCEGASGGRTVPGRAALRARPPRRRPAPGRAPPTGRPVRRPPPGHRRRSPRPAARARWPRPRPRATNTSMPAKTLVRQARWLGRPSTVTRQSADAHAAERPARRA